MNLNQNNYQRRGRGRRKIQIAKIENGSNLEVTYSKRKNGVIKKASELSTLTGAQAAIIMFNPRGKPHSFGSPNVETVANRFLNNNVTVNVNPYVQAHHNIVMHNKIKKQVKIKDLVDSQKKYSIELDNKMSRFRGWLPDDFDNLNFQQLLQLDKEIDHFSDMLNVAAQCNVNGESVQVPQGSARPLIIQGYPSATTNNLPVTFGGQSTIGGGSSGGIDIDELSEADAPDQYFDDTLDNLMFSDCLSTQFPEESYGAGNSNHMDPFGGAGGPYGTHVAGLSQVLMPSESYDVGNLNYMAPFGGAGGSYGNNFAGSLLMPGESHGTRNSTYMAPFGGAGGSYGTDVAGPSQFLMPSESYGAGNSNYMALFGEAGGSYGTYVAGPSQVLMPSQCYGEGNSTYMAPFGGAGGSYGTDVVGPSQVLMPSESYGTGNSTYMAPYGGDVAGPSQVPMPSESWYPNPYPGLAGNMFPPPNGTFGGYSGQSSCPDGNPGDVIPFDGTNFGYLGNFGAGPSNGGRNS